MSIVGFDHVAIPVADPRAMMRFYSALGFKAPVYEEWATNDPLAFSVQFGESKINMHAPRAWKDPQVTLRCKRAAPGCGDFCFVWAGNVAGMLALLAEVGAKLEEGPVKRRGARRMGSAEGTSVYTRDPEGNLLEFIVYAD